MYGWVGVWRHLFSTVNLASRGSHKCHRNGRVNLPIATVFLIEIHPVLWPTGIYWIPSPSSHRQHPHQQQTQLPAFSRREQDILLFEQWRHVVLNQPCMTGYCHPSALRDQLCCCPIIELTSIVFLCVWSSQRQLSAFLGIYFIWHSAKVMLFWNS